LAGVASDAGRSDEGINGSSKQEWLCPASSDTGATLDFSLNCSVGTDDFVAQSRALRVQPAAPRRRQERRVPRAIRRQRLRRRRRIRLTSRRRWSLVRNALPWVDPVGVDVHDTFGVPVPVVADIPVPRDDLAPGNQGVAGTPVCAGNPERTVAAFIARSPGRVGLSGSGGQRILGAAQSAQMPPGTRPSDHGTDDEGVDGLRVSPQVQ
jgi:hypothetical protein